MGDRGFGAAILGDWTSSGIFAARSGRPFTVNQSSNNVGQNMTGLPNHGRRPRRVRRRSSSWFNAGRVPGRALGHVRQRAAQRAARAGLAELRPDALQALRRSASASARSCAGTSSTSSTRTNFGLPNRNLSDAATVGTITTLGGDPRIDAALGAAVVLGSAAPRSRCRRGPAVRGGRRRLSA